MDGVLEKASHLLAKFFSPTSWRGAWRGAGRCASLLLSLGFLLSCSDVDSGSAAPPGVVVEDLERGYGGDRAGLQVGDVLLRWRQDARQGELANLLDWYRLADLGSAHRSVTLHGRRDGQLLDFELPAGEWRLKVRPVDPKLKDPVTSAWRQTQRAAELLATPELAAEAYLDTISKLATGADVTITAWLWQTAGDALVDVNRLPEAAIAFDRVLAVTPATGSRCGLLHYRRALIAFRLSRIDELQAHLEGVFACRGANASASQLASLPDALALILKSKHRRNQGDFENSGQLLEQALEVARHLEPGGALEAEARYEAGILAELRGDLDTAEQHHRAARKLHQDLGLNGTSAGKVEMGLGNLQYTRGDLGEAQRWWQVAEDRFERHAPGSPFHAWALQNLGMAALRRHQPEAAESYLEASLEIRRTFGANTRDVALALENLGSVAHQRGDLSLARQRYREARAIVDETAPESIAATRLLTHLGSLALEAGELEEADTLLSRALTRREENQPASIDHAANLHLVAELAAARGDSAGAQRQHLEALAMRRRLAPGSHREAASHEALARLARSAGGDAAALPHLQRAVTTLEEQWSRLGGARNERARFAARYAPVYKELVATLVRLERPLEAFEILESYRVRGFREQLHARRLNLDRRLPQDLRERRRELAERYDQAQNELAELGDDADSDRVAVALDRLRDLRRQRLRIAAEVERAEPQLAALEAAPVGISKALASLPPGTVALSYSTHPEEILIFGLDPQTGLTVHSAAISEGELRQRVEALRHLLRSPAAGERAETALNRRLRDLYDLLVAPAADLLARADRLLIVPDGPLHALPFAALRGPLQTLDDRYLIEVLPIHVAMSLSVYRTLKDGNMEGLSRASDVPSLIALGDPIYEVDGPRALPRLSESRTEIQGLAELFPDARVHLGAAATEEQVKGLPSRLGYLHLAGHAIIDERSPLDSYLALSRPTGGARENGLLQAWEIFEQMRFDAELVTLSACDTALGEELGGEGLISLTRAFQHAGARAVVASLWATLDRSTAVLMVQFYDYLAEGLPKDEALRQAQLKLLRGHRNAIELGHPAHWAAFQLFGNPG